MSASSCSVQVLLGEKNTLGMLSGIMLKEFEKLLLTTGEDLEAVMVLLVSGGYGNIEERCFAISALAKMGMIRQ